MFPCATPLMRASLSAVRCALVIEGTMSGLGEEQGSGLRESMKTVC